MRESTDKRNRRVRIHNWIAKKAKEAQLTPEDCAAVADLTEEVLTIADNLERIANGIDEG